jgi:hypothetical protein
MLYRPSIITRRALVTGAAALAMMPRDAHAAATVWDSANKNPTIALSGGDLTATMYYKVITIAWDVSAQKIWAYDSNSGLWNNDVIANQNPATGTGGYAPSSMAAGPYYTHLAMFSTGDSCFYNWGATTIDPLPSGFSTWNSAIGTTETWDSGWSSGLFSFSGATATHSGANGSAVARSSNSVNSGKVCFQIWFLSGWGQYAVGNSSVGNTATLGGNTNSVAVRGGQTQYFFNDANDNSSVGWSSSQAAGRATNKYNAGKLMFEATITKNGLNSMVGVGNAGASLALGLGASGMWSYLTNPFHAKQWYNGSEIGSIDNNSNGGTVGFYVDFSVSRLWYYVANGLNRYNSSGTADPATNTGGIDISAIVSTGLYPMVGLGGSASAITTETVVANFAGSFTSPVPSGFVAWDLGTSSTTRSRAVIVQ